MPAERQEQHAGHFVVRFSPPEYRTSLQAAFDLAAELDSSIERCGDPGVTRLKLDWWRKALENASASEHPLVRQLAAMAADPSGLEAMQAMLDAAEADVLRQQPDDRQGFIDHCDRAGALSRLLGLACGRPLPGPEPLGRYVSAVNRVQRLGQRLQQGHNPLPRELGLSGDHTGWDQFRLAEACAGLLDPLRSAAEQVLRDRAARNLPARRWANQARAVHRLLEREGYPVHRQFVDITPFSRLWSAWRVR